MVISGGVDHCLGLSAAGAAVGAAAVVDRVQQRATVEGDADPAALIAAIKDEGFQASAT